MKTKREFPALVAKIESDCNVVINRGSTDGIKLDDKFLIYRLGDEIKDPETQEILGTLEIVLGHGKAIHVQERITTIESDDFKIVHPSQKIIEDNSGNISRILGIRAALNSKTTFVEPTREVIPFKDIKPGDLVKPI